MRPPSPYSLPSGIQNHRTILVDWAIADLRYWYGNGLPILVEAYLERFSELAEDRAAIMELIVAEHEERQRQGESVALTEYEERFPHLRKELVKRLRRDSPSSGPLSGGSPSTREATATLQLIARDCPKILDNSRQRSQVPEQVETLPRPCPDHITPDHQKIAGTSAESPVNPLDPEATQYKPENLVGDGRGRDLNPTDPEATHYQSSAHSSAPLVPGYEILGELGRGGMGVVYKARHLQLHRIVALKVVLGGGHSGSEGRARFLAEATAVATLQHRNIVQVFDFGQSGDLPYMALEYINGGSLNVRLRDGLPQAREAAFLVEQLAQGMAEAHGKGIIHRDLKPHNVLIAAPGENPSQAALRICTFKVTDFGLAKKVEGGSGLTQTGDVMGTPSYMAPEQAAGKTKLVGPATDVYALGAILYECLTGRPPFRGPTVMETILQVQSDDPAPVRHLQPKCPRDLETICHKCLHKDPERRFASARALADDLNRFLNDEPILARRVPSWERAAKWMYRRPSTAALIGVLLMVALAVPIAGWLFTAQLNHRRVTEKKRLEEDQAEVRGFAAQGHTALVSEDWNQAELLLDRAMEKIDSEPDLADLRDEVEIIRGPVKDRLRALNIFKRFVRDQDDALFHATLASGENFQTNTLTARTKAQEALAVVGLSVEGPAVLKLDPAFTADEKREITNGCYALLLMLAEIDTRRLPEQTVEDHRQRLWQALVLLDKTDGLNVRTRVIHLRRARYLTLLGDNARAAQENVLVQKLALETTRDPLDHFLVGHELYSQGQLEQANQEFRRALQLNARHFWTHYFLGICSVTAGKPDVAVAHLSICQSQQPTLVWIYLLRGFALGQMEDYQGAEEDFDHAVALKPSPATLYVLYNNRGVMRISQQDTWNAGVADLKQAAALCPDQHQAQASLAEVYRLAGKLDEAARQLDEAIVIARQQVRTGDVRPVTLALLHHARARLQLQRKDQEGALRDLAETARLAVHDSPLRARADADRGRILHLQKRFEAALAAYDLALKADPSRVDVLRWRGEVLLVQRHYAEAAAAFDAYLENGGTASAAIYRQRGLARAKLNRHVEAIDDYSRALESKPMDEEKSPLHLYRGQEYLTLNELQSALRDFEKARHLNPKSRDAWLGCAHTRVKLGDLQQGVADADMVVTEEPKEPRLWYGAARVYAQAASQLKADTGLRDQKTFETQATRSSYQMRAVEFLRMALQLMPAEQRQMYWRETILKDEVLLPVQRLPLFVELNTQFGGNGR